MVALPFYFLWIVNSEEILTYLNFCSAAHKITKGRSQRAVTKRGIEVVIRREIGTERGTGTVFVRRTEGRVVTETEKRKRAGIAIEKRTVIATGIVTGIAVREGRGDEREMTTMIFPAVEILIIGKRSNSPSVFIFISRCIFSCIPLELDVR